MFLRAADAKEVAQTLYSAVSILGRALQLIVFAVLRTDINKLIADIQTFVNLSNTVVLYNCLGCYYESLQKMPAVPSTALRMRK